LIHFETGLRRLRTVGSVILMARQRPYPKPPPSKCHSVPFYWRGGDIHHERETLSDEYRNALTEHRRAEFELEQTETELQRAIDTLHEREGYTNALASFLDADTEGNIAEQGVKKELPRVESGIRKAELELQEALAVHNPGVAGALIKERAYLLILKKRGQEALNQTGEVQIRISRKLARILTSSKYQTWTQYAAKMKDLNRKNIFLRDLLSGKKKEFVKIPPPVVDQSTTARAERPTLTTQIELEHELQRAQEKTETRPRKWTRQLRQLMNQLEDLNQIMEDLAMPEDARMDIPAIKAQYGIPDEQDPAEEEQPAAESVDDQGPHPAQPEET
jgi:hypothetical protein